MIKINKIHVLLAFLLPVQILLVRFLAQKTNWIETYYSTGIYPKISSFFRFLLGWIPFSVGDLIGIILLICIVKEVYLLIKNKFRHFLSILIRFVAFLSILHGYFYFLWGLNYFRKPLSNKLNLQTAKYSNEQLIKVSNLIVNQLNKAHLKITHHDTITVHVPYSTSKIYELAYKGYQETSSIFPVFKYQNKSVKSSLVSLFQSYNGTSGYINPWTNEAQINNMIYKTGMPATTCHEIAHQLGWAAENEANFIGFLTSTLNPDIYFNYSGYRMAFRYCYGELVKRDKEQANIIWRKLNKGIHQDFKNSREHWKKYDNPFKKYMKKGYNSYLKANNQEKGIDSYHYVVDLLISYYEQTN